MLKTVLDRHYTLLKNWIQPEIDDENPFLIFGIKILETNLE